MRFEVREALRGSPSAREALAATRTEKPFTAFHLITHHSQFITHNSSREAATSRGCVQEAAGGE